MVLVEVYVRLIAALSLVLVGCGVPFQPRGQCHASGWGTIFTEDARPCTCIVQHQDLALQMLRTAGIGEDLSGLTTWLKSSEGGFQSPDGVPVDGYYQSGDAVVIRYGDPLVHEALHYVEHLRGVAPGLSAQHASWTTNTWQDPGFGTRSWWDLAGLYWAKVQPADGGEGCP